MTENEYLCATNQAKVSAVLAIMLDTLPNHGISVSHRAKIIRSLRDAEKKLFASFEMKAS